jgi:hypothetical protein
MHCLLNKQVLCGLNAFVRQITRYIASEVSDNGGVTNRMPINRSGSQQPGVIWMWLYARVTATLDKVHE